MKLNKILLFGSLFSIVLIGLYSPSSFLSKSSLFVPKEVLAADVLRSILNVNTESTKKYTVDYWYGWNLNNLSNTTCPKIYGSLVFGPFDYPVTISFDGWAHSGLSVNGKVINPGGCDGLHPLKFQKSIPSGTKINIVVENQSLDMPAISPGTWTIKNTVFKDAMKQEQQAAKSDTSESGHLIVTFKNGMTKDYQIKSTSANDTMDFVPAITSANRDVSLYGQIKQVTTIHNHPTAVVKNLFGRGLIARISHSFENNNAGWPPSPIDFEAVGNLHLYYRTYVKSYVADADRFWKYDSTLVDEIISTHINKANIKRVNDPAKYTIPYINAVNGIIGPTLTQLNSIPNNDTTLSLF